jgi:hypothetical protein
MGQTASIMMKLYIFSVLAMIILQKQNYTFFIMSLIKNKLCQLRDNFSVGIRLKGEPMPS